MASSESQVILRTSSESLKRPIPNSSESPSKKKLGGISAKRTPRFDNGTAKSTVLSEKLIEKQTRDLQIAGKDADESGVPVRLRSWRNSRLGDQLGSSQQAATFTLKSYNVLADYLAKRHPELYGGINKDLIVWENRFPRLLTEILKDEPDVVCLQEVQDSHYESDFLPAMKEVGFDGVYKKRTHDKQDGCAIFYKSDVLQLLDQTSVEYYQPQVGILDRDNIALLAKFRHKARGQNHMFVVATTHLLYNPRRDDVRLSQMVLLLAELDRFAFDGEGRPYLPVIMTGDMNSQSDSPIYKLLDRNALDIEKANLNYKRHLVFQGPGRSSLFPQWLGITDLCQHADVALARWHRTFSPETKSRLFHSEFNKIQADERRHDGDTHGYPFGNGILQHTFSFRSVYRPAGTRAVTTRQNGYVMVDYIFYSGQYSQKYGRKIEGKLKLLSKLELPSGDDIKAMGNLPNPNCPSDHVSLSAKFLLT